MMTLLAALLAAAATAAPASPETLIELKAISGKVAERMIVLDETSKEMDEAAADAAIAALKKADEALKAAVPDERMKTATERMDGLLRKSREGAAKGWLGSVRAGLSIFYGDKEGVYPKRLEELVPKHVESIPAIELPFHQKTSEVTTIDDPAAKYDQPWKYLKDTGGWLYFGNQTADAWGSVYVDCTHKDSKGKNWTEY